MVEHRGLGALSGLLRALGEPTRREVYLAVCRAVGPVTRAEIAQELAIGTRLAAFHLDRLTAEGLLAADYARPAHRRGGPGAGRPAKHYRTTRIQIDVSVPPRRSDIAASIMGRALEGLGRHNHARRVLLEEARDFGETVAARHDTLLERLADLDYQPVRRPDATIELRNCPFDAVVEVATDTACSMNLALVSGLCHAQADEYEPVLEPAEGRCCVRLRPSERTLPQPRSR